MWHENVLVRGGFSRWWPWSVLVRLLCRSYRSLAVGLHRQVGARGVKVALYHRVSTVDQDPTLAREDLRAYAARLDADIVLDIEETGSGMRNDRPGLLRVLAAATKGRFDTVLVWKLDRFGRSPLDLLAQVRELEFAGVGFICTSQGLNIQPGGDAMSRLTFTLLAAIAEYERAMISERTHTGLQRARSRGVTLGRPRIERPPREKVERLREAGMPWATIAAELGTSMWACRQALAPGRKPDCNDGS